jgi:hypothetical protein
MELLVKERKHFQAFLSSVNSQFALEKDYVNDLIKRGITIDVFQDGLSSKSKSDIASIFFEEGSILSFLYSERNATDFACRFFDG